MDESPTDASRRLVTCNYSAARPSGPDWPTRCGETRPRRDATALRDGDSILPFREVAPKDMGSQILSLNSLKTRKRVVLRGETFLICRPWMEIGE